MLKTSIELSRHRTVWSVLRSCWELWNDVIVRQSSNAPSVVPSYIRHVTSSLLSLRNYGKKHESAGNENASKEEEFERVLGSAFDVSELSEDFGEPLEHLRARLSHQSEPTPLRENIRNFQFTLGRNTHKIEDFAQVGENSSTHFVLQFDGAPGAIPAVVDAIESSDHNWKVQQEGTKVHVEVPEVEKDLKRILRKNCKMHCEECKDELALVKKKYLLNLSKQNSIEPELKTKVRRHLHDLTDHLYKEADYLLDEKLKDLQKNQD